MKKITIKKFDVLSKDFEQAVEKYYAQISEARGNIPMNYFYTETEVISNYFIIILHDNSYAYSISESDPAYKKR